MLGMNLLLRNTVVQWYGLNPAVEGPLRHGWLVKAVAGGDSLLFRLEQKAQDDNIVTFHRSATARSPGNLIVR